MATISPDPIHTKYAKALGIIRILVGLTFLMHGSQKLFVFHFSGVAGMMQHLGIPFPGVAAVLATLAEFLGGLFLLFGLLSRLAAIPVAVNMLVAITRVHWSHGFIGNGGYEYPLLLLVVLLSIVAVGGGAFAFDNLIWKHRSSEFERAHPIAA